MVCCGMAVFVFAAIDEQGKLWQDLAYMVSGCCGTYAVLNICQIWVPKQKKSVLGNAGKNSILIYGTHHFYYAVIGVLLGVKDFATTPIMTGLAILTVVIALEIPTIYMINRWLPLLAGKWHRPKAVL